MFNRVFHRRPKEAAPGGILSSEVPSTPASGHRSSRPPGIIDSLDFIRQGDIRAVKNKRFQSYRLIGA